MPQNEPRIDAEHKKYYRRRTAAGSIFNTAIASEPLKPLARGAATEQVDDRQQDHRTKEGHQERADTEIVLIDRTRAE
jgi:hypothetical protein